MIVRAVSHAGSFALSFDSQRRQRQARRSAQRVDAPMGGQ
jgi:hypothetical protein